MPTCGGLVDKLCQPCPEGGPDGFCNDLIDECSRIFCTPMCKRTTWTCRLDFGEFSTEAGDQERYEDALCAHFINEGCSTILDCCPRDDFLRQDVADRVNRDSYPTPALPTPSCVHDPAGPAGDQLCEKCNAQVKVSLEKKECAYPPTPGPGPSFLELAQNVAESERGAHAETTSFLEPKKLTIDELYAKDELLLSEIEAMGDRQRRFQQETLETPASFIEQSTEYFPTGTHQDAGLGAQLAQEEIQRMYGLKSRTSASFIADRMKVAHKKSQSQSKSSRSFQTRGNSEGVLQPSKKSKVKLTPQAEQTVASLVEAEISTRAQAGGGGDGVSENGNARRFGAGVTGFPGAPTYYGLNDRCNALAQRVEGMFGQMQSVFQEKVCNCMGCCAKPGEPTCFFPLWEVIGSAPGEEASFLEMDSKVEPVSSNKVVEASYVPLSAIKSLPVPQLSSFIEQQVYFRDLRRKSRWAKYWDSQKLKSKSDSSTER